MAYEALRDQLKPSEIRLENIYLDPNNPRFTGADWTYVPDKDIPSAQVQEAVRLRLVREFGVNRLRLNMEVNGYLPIDRVVIREFEEEKFVVLEGNRRICAAKMISQVTQEGLQVSGKVLESLQTIPCLIYTGADYDVAWILQGLRHITGLVDWSSFNKAKLLVEQMEKEPLSLTDVGRRFGLTAFGAGQWVRGYYTFKQARERSDYVGEVDERVYPYFQELFSRSSARVREWMGWDDHDREFKDELKFNEFIGWFYPRPQLEEGQVVSEPTGDWERRVISRQYDIWQLAYLLGHDHQAFEQFRLDLDLEKAYATAIIRHQEQSAKELDDTVEETFSSIKICTKALDNLPFKLLRQDSGRENLLLALEPLEDAIKAIREAL